MILGGDAGPSVLHRNRERDAIRVGRARFRLRGHADGTGFGKLDRVADHVDEDLPQARLIEDNRGRHSVVDPGTERQVLAPHLAEKHVVDLGKQRVDRHRLQFERDAPGFDF